MPMRAIEDARAANLPTPSSCLRLLSKCTHEGAAFAVKIPRHSQAWPTVSVRESHGGHGMRQLGQRRVVADFVAAQVVVFTNGARLNRGQLARAKHGGTVMLGTHDQLHLRRNHL